MRVTRLVAGTAADPADWMTWLTTVALSLGLPDPMPEPAARRDAEGNPLPADPDRIERSTIIPLEAFPALLRPMGVDPVKRSVGLSMVIRRALYSTQTGIDSQGMPTFASQDRGWECDIAIYPGPGRAWDVHLLPDIITMSVQTGGTLEWQAQTRGTLELPCTPDGWARIDPEHPTVVYAVHEPPAVVSGPIDPPTPPGAP
jgi:hypothetical protein